MMKLLRPTKLSLLLVLLCAGCVSSTDVSQRAPYRDYAGHTLTLNRPVLLVERGSSVGLFDGVRSLGYAKYGLVEPDDHHAGPVYAKLSAGHRVVLDSIREELFGDNQKIVVYGHVPGKEGETFAYDSGLNGYRSSPLWKKAN